MNEQNFTREEKKVFSLNGNQNRIQKLRDAGASFSSVYGNFFFFVVVLLDHPLCSYVKLFILHSFFFFFFLASEKMRCEMETSTEERHREIDHFLQNIQSLNGIYMVNKEKQVLSY